MNNTLLANDDVIKRQYDYIIIGGGSAGCVIAGRLAANSEASVLLIESGGSNANIPEIENPLMWAQNIGSSHDYAYTYAPGALLKGRINPAPRGKVLGGSGSINAMMWARGTQSDYDSWATAGNTGWDYQSILPLFRQIEDWEGGASSFHGAGGPIAIENVKDPHPLIAAFSDSCQAMGMPLLKDTNGNCPEGVGPMCVNFRENRRSGPTAYLNLPSISGKRNLTVLTNTKALKLQLSSSRCTGVELLRNGEILTIEAAREVILSAGTIDTPRILMLSGIGDPEDLFRLGIPAKVNLPGVGKNLQDHPILAGLCFEANQPLSEPRHNLLGGLAIWKSKQRRNEPDLHFLPIQVPVLTPELARGHDIPPNAFTLSTALIKPLSRGYIKLKTAAHDGPVDIQPNFLAEPQDLAALIAGVEIAMYLANRPGLKEIIKRWIIPNRLIGKPAIVQFIQKSLQSYYHPVGTCAMGKGSEAVVNSELLVHGMSGLRIADASVMPNIPSANTNAATMMIGEFAVREILKHL